MLTHWFYLYLPWFFPFVAFALLAPAASRDRRSEPMSTRRELVAPAELARRGARRRGVALPRAWGVLHARLLRREQIVDTPVYESYGDAMERGQVPYRDFAVEYPPGALPVFVVPALARRRDVVRAVFEG